MMSWTQETDTWRTCVQWRKVELALFTRFDSVCS